MRPLKARAAPFAKRRLKKSEEFVMPFASTRGAQPVSASQAIVRGIAPDGGLYAPQDLSPLSREDFSALSQMP